MRKLKNWWRAVKREINDIRETNRLNRQCKKEGHAEPLSWNPNFCSRCSQMVYYKSEKSK